MAGYEFRVERFAPGQQVQGIVPGDFILTHASSWTSYLIRFAESWRYLGKNKRFAHWSHAAIFVSPAGDIIEALGGGVQKRNIEVYRDTEYCVVRLGNLPPQERANSVAFAEYCLGRHYGFLTIASLAITLLTGAKFFFGVDGQMICSGLVARAVERTGAIFQYDSWHMMPADLAEHFDVEVQPGAAKGTIPKRNYHVMARSS